MKSIKIENKYNQKHVVIKSLKGEILNEHEVRNINNANKNLINISDVNMKRNSFVLFYNISGFVSLRQYIYSNMDQTKFAILIQNIISCFNDFKKNHIDIDYLYLDLDYVMVNTYNSNILFIYVPIQGNRSNISIKLFLTSIAKNARFEGDKGYLAEYYSVLEKSTELSLVDLGLYIDKLLNKKSDNFTYICPKCHTVHNKKVSYCGACGYKVTGNTDNMKNATLGIDDFIDEESLNDDSNDSSKIHKNNYGSTTPLISKKAKTPYLINVFTREKIKIDCDVFRIGRLSSNNLSFTSNTAVSKQHAVIMKRKNRFYVSDLGSLNGTYVDENIVEKNRDVEIFDETKLTFANEEFIFRLI